jgi:hypothetical protein
MLLDIFDRREQLLSYTIPCAVVVWNRRCLYRQSLELGAEVETLETARWERSPGSRTLQVSELTQGECRA